MKAKTRSGFVVLLCVCMLLVLSVFVIPIIIARPPKNREITALAAEAFFPEETGGYQDEPSQEDKTADSIIDINAIPQERAIQLAYRSILLNGSSISAGVSVGSGSGGSSNREVTTTILGAGYVDRTDPTADPVWLFLVSVQCTGENYELIPGALTAEEYLVLQERAGKDCRIGVNRDGIPVLVLPYDLTVYYIIEVNALTGECIGWSGSPTSVLELDMFSMDGNLWQNVMTWEPIDVP